MAETGEKVKTDPGAKVLMEENGEPWNTDNNCRVGRDRVVKPSLLTSLLYSLTIYGAHRNCSRVWGYSSAYARESTCLQGADMTKEEDKFLNKMEI